MADTQRINGFVPSWGDIYVKINSARYYGITEIAYGDTRVRSKLYGMARHHAPRGRTSGKYEINGQLQIALNATGYRSVQVRLNAAGSGTGGTQLAVNTVDASSAALVSLPIPTVEYDLTAGDYVEMFVQQNSGGSLNTVTGAGITFLRIKLVGS